MPWGYGWFGWGRGRGRGWFYGWPGRGPWSFLPPWLRPGWVFGRGACWYFLANPYAYQMYMDFLRNYGYYGYPAPPGYSVSEKEYLESELKYLEDRMREVERRLKELKGEQ